MYEPRRGAPRRFVRTPNRPPDTPPEPGLTYWQVSNESEARPRSVRTWLADLSPIQQLGYGCIGIMIVGALVLYCLGGAAFMARPSLMQRPPTATELIRPTLLPTPTQPIQATLAPLPRRTLIATPTQAPIPTREPVTTTPTPGEPPFGTTWTPTPTSRFTPTQTRKPTPTVIVVRP